jgi:hypothetical protein
MNRSGLTAARLDPGRRAPAARRRTSAVHFGVVGVPALLIVGVAGVNAARGRNRQCACLNDCWCKTTLGGHLRWLVPASHHKLPPTPYRGEPQPPSP